jgi:hypothetical protein
MASIGGSLAGRSYSAPARPRPCAKVAASPRWEWRCTRDRCVLAEPMPRIIDGRYRLSDRERCGTSQRVR